jgi:hypothetical protein
MTRPQHSGLAFLLAAGLVLGACSKSSKTERNSSGTVTKAGMWSVFDLHPGDCLLPPKELDKEIDQINVVPCTDAHTQEVYGSVKHTADAFPGVGVLSQFADSKCVGELQTKLGVSPSAGYYVSYLLPSFDSWNKDNDRSVTCVLVFPTEKEKKGSAVNEAMDAMKAKTTPTTATTVKK